ncbi:MAG: type II toxin-antitoxin system RelE/ParE family toxin [Bacteroidetes bacterium]|nr:type II toxin-antitoxin system RelE/ParE family toxin [Bacteroidota bacterium]MBS1941252.1 type II toxin-antitoxin system RelE/ParE family toxin [Bacteroidota bacterium]
MAKAVRWTPKAIDTYINVLRYLRDKWTTREEQRFVNEVEKTIRYIVLFPKGFRSAGHARLREAPIKPYNILLYRIDRSAIVVIGLFDMRRHPKHLKQLKSGWKKA